MHNPPKTSDYQRRMNEVRGHESDIRHRQIEQGSLIAPSMVCTKPARVNREDFRCNDCSHYAHYSKIWVLVSGLTCDACKDYRDTHSGYSQEQVESLEEDYRSQIEKEQREHNASSQEGLHP